MASQAPSPCFPSFLLGGEISGGGGGGRRWAPSPRRVPPKRFGLAEGEEGGGCK